MSKEQQQTEMTPEEEACLNSGFEEYETAMPTEQPTPEQQTTINTENFINVTLDLECEPRTTNIVLNGVECFYDCSLNAITGAEGSRKSTLAYYISTMLIQQTKRVLYFDTEQDLPLLISNINKLNDNIICNAELFSDCFKLVSVCNETNYENRRTGIASIIEKVKPDAVFIDNITDLFESFNDEINARQGVEILAKIARDYKCPIICICHHTKSSKLPLGHVGSALLRKCSTILTCEDSNGQSIVTMPKNRGIKADAFAIKNPNGYPELVDDFVPQAIPVQTEQTKENANALKNAIIQKFGRRPITRKEIVDLIMNLMPSNAQKPRKEAERKFSEMYYTIFQKQSRGIYLLKDETIIPDETTTENQNELPF